MVTSAAAAALSFARAIPRRMTRCECAGVTFDDLQRRMRAEGLSVQEACRKTGCGQCCSACVPDLQAFLAAPGAR